MTVMLESVPSIRERHHAFFWRLEWFFTAVFTIEYMARLAVVRKKRKYALSFFGIVNLFSIPQSVYWGIVTMMRDVRMDSRECGQCGWKGHDPAANYCKHCGHTLHA